MQQQLEEASASLALSDSALPRLPTVEEAARALGIGRSLGYRLARLYEATGGTEGLPVIRVGTVLRVPEWALVELMRTGRVVNLHPRTPNLRIARG